MSDHNLRLHRSIIFPLTRRSGHSKSAIQASLNRAEATRAASILNLSKSFRNSGDRIRQPPNATISVRNFAISLVVSSTAITARSPSPPRALDDIQDSVAEYAVVLECLSLWATTNPDWPDSVIIPTPTCLRNSFRLIIPSSDSNKQPKKTHVITFPALRRERSTLSSQRIQALTSSKSAPSILDLETKSLTDESEPECSGLSEDEGIEPLRREHWTEDEHSARYEGVFQSTNELCVSMVQEDLVRPESISAQRAETRLTISIHRGKNLQATDLKSLSLRLTLQVLLHHVSLNTKTEKVPIVFHLPDFLAQKIVASEWSAVTGDSVLESLVPFHESKPQTPPRVVSESQECTPRNGDRAILSTSVSMPDLELLNTSAPFGAGGALGSATSWETEDGDIEASFEGPLTPTIAQPCSPLTLVPNDILSTGDVRGRFVVWYDLESLIRQITPSTPQEKLSLKFNLHGQVELSLDDAHSPFNQCELAMPVFGFPTINQQECMVEISGDPTLLPEAQALEVRMPMGARREDVKGDGACKIKMDIRTIGPEIGPDESLIVRLSNPVSSPPSRPPTPALAPAVNLSSVSPAPLISAVEDLAAMPVRVNKRYPAASARHRLSVGSFRKRSQSHDLSPRHLTSDAKEAPEPVRIVSASIEVAFQPHVPLQPSRKTTQFIDLSLTFARGCEGEVQLSFPILGALKEKIELVDASEPVKVDQDKREVKVTVSARVRDARMVVKVEKPAGSDSDEIECLVPSFSCSVAILDVRIQTKLRLSQTSLSTLSLSPLINLRQYALPANAKNIVQLSEGLTASGSWNWKGQEMLCWKNLLRCWLVYLVLSHGMELGKLVEKVDGLTLNLETPLCPQHPQLVTPLCTPCARIETFDHPTSVPEVPPLTNSTFKSSDRGPFIGPRQQQSDQTKWQYQQNSIGDSLALLEKLVTMVWGGIKKFWDMAP
ncbi:hypothetical protein CROQUDRAFT_671516 [Cronartium quercuum f. sp. fusiforme G11]|uniref:Uncharacterized protein n=1 Tax=Cronartium quercuum f. sp. fusiforme G11 TaxID=708437 RepID=A0A9P6NH03_9BASI|nr:hypothetical protein CROQUDRAFT_671516 [Cronartium quercuum f. sp. fusiforme G11]